MSDFGLGFVFGTFAGCGAVALFLLMADWICGIWIRRRATPPQQPQVATQGPAAPNPIYKVGDPYVVNGVRYEPKEDPTYNMTGIASWYGPDFHGKPTANGEVFDMNEVTAAHQTLPLPSLVRVTNLATLCVSIAMRWVWSTCIAPIIRKGSSPSFFGRSWRISIGLLQQPWVCMPNVGEW